MNGYKSKCVFVLQTDGQAPRHLSVSQNEELPDDVLVEILSERLQVRGFYCTFVVILLYTLCLVSDIRMIVYVNHIHSICRQHIVILSSLLPCHSLATVNVVLWLTDWRHSTAAL